MKHTLYKLIVALIVTVFLSSQARAGTIVCSGKISVLAFHTPNGMMIQLDSMNVPVYFCKTDEVHTVAGTPYSTSPETCKTLYSTFLAVKAAGKTVSGMYFDGDSAPTTCNGWSGAWLSANIRYFSLND